MQEVLYASPCARITWGTCMPLLPSRTMMAIGAVVDIAMNSGKEPVSAHDLEDRLHLPRRYLEPTLQALVREGILRAARGRNGGYGLAKERDAISVRHISEAVETVEIEKQGGAGLLGAVVMPALMKPQQSFASALERISVEDLVQAARLQMLANYEPDAMTG
jgi:Rrf2 family transcriptional regulator, iron-sulfur cluster assembly transcription factor